MAENESYERALADVELLQAAYPDEIVVDTEKSTSTTPGPLQVKLLLTPDHDDTYIVLEWPITGYPVTNALNVASYRSSTAAHKARIDQAVTAIRQTAQDCCHNQVEAGMACVAAALDTWHADAGRPVVGTTVASPPPPPPPPSPLSYHWISGPALRDRKSSFQAHACRISFESQVRPALAQLLQTNAKLQRATHNMWAYRLYETTCIGGGDKNGVWKHDNDDDGEDAAGGRLAQLLAMRNEMGVLIVVSRWFGGVHLGPKRFAHICNVARDLLEHCHETNWESSSLPASEKAIDRL